MCSTRTVDYCTVPHDIDRSSVHSIRTAQNLKRGRAGHHKRRGHGPGQRH
jgi:hypothetical protein